MKFLKGKKTYVTAVLAVVAAAAAYANGEASTIDAIQLAFTGVLGAFIRAGVNK